MNAPSTTPAAAQLGLGLPNDRGGAGRGGTAATTRNTRLLEAELQAERRHAAQLEARLQLAQATLRRLLADSGAEDAGDGPAGNGRASADSVQSMLGQALEELEEQRVAAIELRTVLAATETRVDALNAELSGRGEERTARGRKSAKTLEDGRRQQAVLEQHLEQLGRHVAGDAHAVQLLEGCRKAVRSLKRQLSSGEELHGMLESVTRDLSQRQQELDEFRGLSAASAGAEQAPATGAAADGIEAPALAARLRDTEEMLRQSLEELEEQRILAIELRTVLAATEHRVEGLVAEVAARDRALESERKKQTQERKRVRGAVADAVAQRDAKRQEAAEARTMLLAMEGRMRALESTVAAREQERDALRLQLAREHEAARARRAEREVPAPARALAPRLQTELRSLRRRAHRLEEKAVAYEHGAAAQRVQAVHEKAVRADLQRRLAASEAESARLQAACAAAVEAQRKLRAAGAELQARLEHALAARSHESRRLSAELHETLAACRRAELAREQNEHEVAGLQQKVEELHRERERSRSLLREAEERQQSTKAAATELRSTLEVAEQKRRALEAEVAERESEVAALQDSVNGERAEQAQLRQQLAQGAAELESAREREGVRAKEIRDLMARCRDLGAQVGEAQSSEQRMRAELSALQRLRADESPELERLREQMSALAEERQNLERQLAASERRCEELGEELAAAADTAQTAEQHRQDLRTARAEIAKLQEHSGELERTVQAAREREKERASEVRQLGERAATLAAQLTESEDRERHLHGQLADQQADLKMREGEAERLQAEVHRVTETSRDLQARVDGLEAAARSAAERGNSLETDVRELGAQSERLRTELAARETQLREAEENTRTLQAQLAEASEARERAAASFDESRRSLEVLERELREARALLEERQETVAELQERCTRESAEQERLLEELIAAQRVREEQEGQSEAIRDELAAAREREHELCARMTEQQAVLEGAEAAIGELRLQLEEATRAETLTVPEPEGDQDAGAGEEEEDDLVLLQEQSIEDEAEAPAGAADVTEQERPGGEPSPDPSRNGTISVLHLEDDAALRDVLRAALEGMERIHYLEPCDADGTDMPAASLVAANLLASAADPLQLLSCAQTSDGRAFLYCTDGQKGRVVGTVDYFPHPFHPETCATRLLERPQGVSRLLAVSEAVEAMHELRTLLGRARCSTTVALDLRQALDLIELVHPNVVLIDMSLPRGEGVELLNRLRTDQQMAELEIALLWTHPHDQRGARRRLPRLLGSAPFSNERLTGAFQALLCGKGAAAGAAVD